MACPTIKITLRRSYVNDVDNPIFQYEGSIDVQVISGSSTTPLSGSLVLVNPNGDINYSLSNNTNSFTYGYFDVTGQELYESLSAVITLFANESCYKQLTINLTSEILGCQTIVSGNQITDDCYYETTISEWDILGCTDSTSTNYNSDATVDDGSCIYDEILGCTNPDSLNYNPNATVDDGSCIAKVYGCIDPLAINYNPEANVDDGSCLYGDPPVVLGCTNPLASNYNSEANFNDGTCVFVSGCTNPSGDNYNPLAVVDDGSCECNKVELVFELDGENEFYFLSSGDVNCDYYLEFDYRLKIDCEKFIDYFENKTGETVLNILDDLTFYSEVRDNGNVYRQLEYNLSTGDTLYNIELDGNSDSCITLKTLLAEELGENCPNDVSDKFNSIWQTARLKIPADFLNKFVKVGFYLEGFGFGATVLLDDIKLYKLCFSETQECVIVPYNFGFSLDTVIDNKKTSLDNNELILNTKEIDLKINVPNYIVNDVISFLNTYEHLLNKVFKGITKEKLEKEFINPSNVLTQKCYFYYLHLYEQYVNSFTYCSAKSKELGYEFLFEVLTKIGTDWVNLIKQFLPVTTIWKEHSKYYANTLLHQQKYYYKNYFLVDNSNGEDVEKDCTLITKEECSDNSIFVAVINQRIINTTGECLYPSTTSPSNLTSTNYGGGRLLQYDKTDGSYIQRYDYPNKEFIICA